MRWFSSRIGEGLIYDLRTQVFDHVQRQPIAFFTRTQTGALVCRLNNDVIGAQQAFTSTLSGVVSQPRLAGPGDGRDARACPGRSRSALAGHAADLPAAGPAASARRLQQLTRESMQLNAEMGTHDDRAVQRRRRAAGQAVRPARRRRTGSSPNAPAGSATSACGSRCTNRVLLHRADPGRLAGHRRWSTGSAAC